MAPKNADHEARLQDARVGSVLVSGGRFVLGDLITPDNPADIVTPVDGVYDMPSSIPEQEHWLEAAGLKPRVAWTRRDLAVLVADRPDRSGAGARG